MLKDLVEKILLQEIENNKTKAEEYLDIQINSHKRFVNSEHPDFSMNKELKKNGIRFKNHFNLWFKEEIPNRGEEVKMEPREDNEDEEDYETYGAAQGKKCPSRFYIFNSPSFSISFS